MSPAGPTALRAALQAVVEEGPARPAVACRRLADGAGAEIDGATRLPTVAWTAFTHLGTHPGAEAT